MRLWSAAGLALVLLAPGAMAASGSATLVGPVELGDATLRGPIHSLLVNDTSTLRAFTLTAPELIVHRYSESYAAIPGVRPRALANETAEYALHDATLTLSARSEGWLGIYALGPLSIDTPRAPTIEIVASLASTLTNGQAPDEATPMPERQVYSRTLAGPHFDVALPDASALQGALGLKVRGPAITIVAKENTTTMPTGEEQDTASVTTRWVYVEAPQARIDMSGGAPRALSPGPLALAWRALDSKVATLTIDDGLRAYASADAPARVQGDLTSVVRANELGASEITLEGTLTSTTARLTLARTPEWTRLGAIVLGVALAGAIGTLAYRRSRRARGLGPDDHADLASRALERGDHAQAAAWLSRARAQARTSARLLIDEAYARAQMGEHDAALELYAQAARASGTGEADELRARLLATLGRDAEAIEALREAFTRDPWLILGVEADEAFAQVRGQPAYEELARDARRRTG